MANEQAKFLNSRRRHKTDVAIARQVKIAKKHFPPGHDIVKETHRLAKHHAMDCGNPRCSMCGNPRRSKITKTNEKLTAQEKRLFQDLDAVTDKHSNGLKPQDDAAE